MDKRNPNLWGSSYYRFIVSRYTGLNIDECVTDNQIIKIANYLNSEQILLFEFRKCVRPVFNEIRINWTFQSVNLNTRKNRLWFMRELMKILNDYLGA